MPSTHIPFEFTRLRLSNPWPGLHAKGAQHHSMKGGSTYILQNIIHIAASEPSASAQAVRFVFCLGSNARPCCPLSKLSLWPNRTLVAL